MNVSYVTGVKNTESYLSFYDKSIFFTGIVI